MSRKNNLKKIQGWKKCNSTQIYLECKEMEVWGVCPHAHCNTPTHARDSQVHRLTALSKKCFTDGSFPFFFRMTDLSTELRWCPICLCTFKIHTHTHTSLLLTQGDACSRNKLNQMSALQISFLIPFSPPLWPLLLFFLITGSPTREWYRTTSNSPSSLHRFIFLAVSSSAVKSQRRRAPLRRTHLAQRSRWLSNRSEAGEQARLASRARLSIVKYVKMMQKAFANPNKKRCIQCIRTQASRQWRPD